MISYYAVEKKQIKKLPGLEPFCWINITPPFDQNNLKELANTLEVPLDFFSDSLDVDERSRYEKEDDVRLIVINAPILNSSEKENDAIYITVPIGIIVTLENVITIAAQAHPVIDRFLDSKVRGFDPGNEAHFVLKIFERTVNEYLNSLKDLNNKRNRIEEELYSSSRNAELKQLLRIEKSLVYFVNSLSTNELLKMKMKRTDLLKIRDDEVLMDLFDDIIIDNSQALEMSNVHTNILSGTMDAYSSIISNNLNTFIQRLTLITIVLMVPTLVASFYGMNVELPMGKSPYAFAVIVGITIVLILGMMWFFKRKRLF